MQKRKWFIAAGSAVTAVLALTGFFIKSAYAYTLWSGMSAYSNIVQLSDGSLAMDANGNEQAVESPGPYAALYKQKLYVAEVHDQVYKPSGQLDGQGDWPFLHGDVYGEQANNGYLLIGDTDTGSSDVQQWIQRLGGNETYVENYLKTNDQMTFQNQTTRQTSDFDAFSALVTESGAKFGTQTTTPTGQTETYGGSSVNIMKVTYPIYESAPPTATSIGIEDGTTYTPGTVTQGDPIDFTLSSTINLWSGEATHHWDAVQLTDNSTGQSIWAVGSGSGDFAQMQAVGGGVSAGNGPQTDSSANGDISAYTNTSSLQPGTYTATFWVADGVDRISSPVTTTFTITPSTGPTVSVTANPTNLPTGQSSTLTATGSNLPSGDELKIVNQTTGEVVATGQAGQTTLTSTQTESQAVTETYVAKASNPTKGSTDATSSLVSVTWTSSTSSSSPSPTSCPTQLATINQGSVTSTQDSVTIINQTSDPLSFSSGNSSITLSQSSTSAGMDAAVTATFSGGVNNATLTITDTADSCTQTYPIYDSSYTPPASADITLSADPTTLGIGGSTTLSASVDSVHQGAFLDIYDQSTGQIIAIGTYEQSYSTPPDWNVKMSGVANGQVQYSGTYSTTYSSKTQGPQTFVAYEWNKGVSTIGPPSEKSAPVTVTWVKPSITMQANPTSVFSGLPSQLSYSTVGFSSGDYVEIIGTGGQNMWQEAKDTSVSDSFSETEDPTNGSSTSVKYTANLLNSDGTLMATTNLSVTWTAPTIKMAANPTFNMPGQPSNITYAVNAPLPSDVSVKIMASGNGADMWNASGLTSQTGSDQEVENPSGGASITVNYTGEVINDSTGQIMATGSTSVSWSNPWAGTINLSANPLFCATGSSTTLMTKTSQAVPNGWSLIIMDQSTGQMVSSSGSSPESAQYTSYTANTHDFIAYLNDGYENVGNPSNEVQVVWSALSLSANPTQLPVGKQTTLTVTGMNVPSGDYMVVYDQLTGQLVGDSQSTPYSMQISESTPQTDDFIAYISGNSNSSDEYMSSNVVAVSWYGITLVANPARLPISHMSTLTATAQNLPGAYVIDIVDLTANKIIATGQPGQTVLNAFQTRNQVETDQYEAQVVEPGNPNIPELSYSSSNGQYTYQVDSSANDIRVFDSSSGSMVTTIPVGDYPSSIVYTGSLLYVTNQLSNTVSVINPITNTVVDTISGGGMNYPYGIAYGNGNIYVSNWAGSIYTSSVTVIPTSTNIALPSVATGGMGAMGITYNNGYVYVVNTLSNNVGVVNASNNQEVYTYTLPPKTYTWTTTLGMTMVSGPSTVEVPYPQGSYVQASGYGTSFATVGTGTSEFPFWTFANAPNYIPHSVFGEQAQYSSYSGAVWTSNSSSQQNGTAFFEATFNLPQTDSVTFNIPSGESNDYEQVYVDGSALMQFGTSGGGGGGVPSASSTTITLPAGMHQVIIEAENNNSFTGSSPNPAGAALNVIANGIEVLSTANASDWNTTGYVTQLPPGWFSGSVGSWTFTEYVMQENAGQPILQQQTYTVTNTAQTISATSSPVSVTWFNPVIAPDNFTLAPLPANVVKPASTLFHMTLDSTDQKFVDEALKGKAKLVIKNVETWQSVVSADWTPDTDGLNVDLSYSPVPGTSLQYLAELVDPATNEPVAISNQVTVKDTGNGNVGNSYTSETCGPNGDGTEIFTTYTNGKVTATKTLPLTMTGLEMSGLYHPPQDLINDLGTVKMPITNAEIGNGPIPVRVQAPFAFAIKFPDAQPTTVTATLSVNEAGYTVDTNGDRSWTVKMHQATNLGFGYWQGETIMPKLPNGMHISISITATDECGTNTTPTGVFPYNDFAVTDGRPIWYFVQSAPLPNGTNSTPTN